MLFLKLLLLSIIDINGIIDIIAIVEAFAIAAANGFIMAAIDNIDLVHIIIDSDIG